MARADVAVAAWGGLQDSAPRSGLLSLHARVRDVDPDAWEDGGLVQVWGPRMAVYLVQRADAAVFTLGRSPRDPNAMARLEAMGERAAAVNGRVHLRWDTRRTLKIAVDPGDVDAEEARLELARRFLGWLGPGTAEQFAKWAGVEEVDAITTLAALEGRGELALVTVAGKERSVLARDVDALSASTGVVQGVRLLPQGDPYLARDRALLARDKHEYDALFGRQKYVPGGVYVDGQIVGTWSRQEHRVTLRPWPWEPLAAGTAARVHEEAASFAGPLGREPDISWS